LLSAATPSLRVAVETQRCGSGPKIKKRLLATVCSAADSREAGAERSSADLRWEERYTELLEYKAEWGHCNVVLGSTLGRWVYLQRDLAEEGKLSEERAAKLGAAGFEWQHPFDTAGGDWEEMRGRLAAFREEFGHGDVKKKYDADPALGYWVNEQRIAKREGRLSEGEVAALESVGMEWEARKKCGSKFMVGFRELLAYREEFGTVDLPAADPQWAGLRAWAQAQRGARKKGILSEKRVAYLDGVDFKWEE